MRARARALVTSLTSMDAGVNGTRSRRSPRPRPRTTSSASTSRPPLRRKSRLSSPREVRDQGAWRSAPAHRRIEGRVRGSPERELRRAELDRRLTEDVVDVTLPRQGRRLGRSPLERSTPARDRGRVPRARVRGDRRPGRDRPLQLRPARVPARAPDAISPRHVLPRRGAPPPHRDRRPRRSTRWRRRSRRSTWSRSGACTGATRSRRPGSRSSTSSRARGRPHDHALGPQGDAARDARALRRGPPRSLPHALLPVHRAVDRARRRARSATCGLPHVQVHGLDRARRRGDGRPAVLANVGLDPEEWTGFAFGCGIERAAQLRHGISEIRPFWENDLRVLRQF